MATLEHIYGLVAYMPPSLRQRIEAAWLVKMEAILGEDAGTANHAKRAQLAEKCLEPVTRQKVVGAFVAVIATNETIQTEGDNIDDGAIHWLIGHYVDMATFVDGALALP